MGFENEPMDVNMPPVMAAKESGMRNLDLIRGCEAVEGGRCFRVKTKNLAMGSKRMAKRKTPAHGKSWCDGVRSGGR